MQIFYKFLSVQIISNLTSSNGERIIYTFFSDDFLHTTIENAVLTSPIFQFDNEMICIQLLIGLCIECDANIVLRDFTKDEVLAMATVKGSSRAAEHNLPMWQSVKIMKNLSMTDYNSYNRVIIQLVPKLNKHSLNPLWAIANVRQCPRDGTNLVIFYFLITFGIFLMLIANYILCTFVN